MWPMPPLAPKIISVSPALELQLVVQAAQGGDAVRAQRAGLFRIDPGGIGATLSSLTATYSA